MRYLLVLLLAGCVGVDTVQSQISERGAQINDEALQSAEFVICRGVSVGAWRRAYGASAEKAAAWRVLCAESISQTP